MNQADVPFRELLYVPLIRAHPALNVGLALLVA
jgi:hypothetical protein